MDNIDCIIVIIDIGNKSFSIIAIMDNGDNNNFFTIIDNSVSTIVGFDDGGESVSFTAILDKAAMRYYRYW